MGIPLEFVLSEEGHQAEFTCKVCLQLVEYPLYLQTCHHIFCKVCIDQWWKTQASQGEAPVCPTCKANVSTGRVRDLKDAEPLAWRVMGRIRVRCPLGRSSGCNWQGEYYSLANHLLSRELHTSDVKEQGDEKETKEKKAKMEDDDAPDSLAEALKEQGNNKFQQGSYREAISLYSKAISAAPKIPAFYCNRAAAWLMLGAYTECVKDCEAALKLDSAFEKGWLRLTKALCALGEFEIAALQSQRGIDELQQRGKDVSGLQQERRAAIELRDCVLQAARCLSQEPQDAIGALSALHYAMTLSQASKLVVMAAQAEISLGRPERAITMLMPILRAEPQNASAYAVRGQALFYRADYEQASKHVREALNLDPDSPEFRKLFQAIKKTSKAAEAGKSLFSSRRFEDAEKMYTEAIEAIKLLQTPTPAKQPGLQAELQAERGACLLRLEKFQEALADAEAALGALDDCKRAYVVKASALTKLGRPNDAVQALQGVVESYGQGDTELRGAYDRAVFEVRKHNRPDYYQILGVPSIASTVEIKRAYKQKALETHPDKVADQGEEAEKKATEQFKVLQDALEVLTGDPMSRKLYDEGYDKETIKERLERAARAARDDNHRH